MRSTSRVAATIAAACLALTACGGGEDAAESDFNTVSDGTLTVCSDIPYAPFEFEDADAPTGYSGFDIELIEAIAEELDLDVAVTVSGFEGLTSGTAMATGECDLAASAMTITEERAQQVDFSDPYYDAVQSLLVPDGSDIESIDDLVDGRSVGVQSGTTGEEYADENVPGAEIIRFENPGDLFVAMEAEQVDAILQDQPVNVEYARENDSTVVDEYDTQESYGFAFGQDREDDLLSAVNSALESVRDAGTYDEIYDRYFAVD